MVCELIFFHREKSTYQLDIEIFKSWYRTDSIKRVKLNIYNSLIIWIGQNCSNNINSHLLIYLVGPNYPMVRHTRISVEHSVQSAVLVSLLGCIIGPSTCSDTMGKEFNKGNTYLSSIRSVNYLSCHQTYAYIQGVTWLNLDIIIMLQGSTFPVHSHMSVWIKLFIHPHYQRQGNSSSRFP